MGTIEIIGNVELLTELRNVITRSKFTRQLARRGFSSLEVFYYYIELVTIVVPALITPTVTRDPADDEVLPAAIGGRADLIVSGDAHLLNLKSFQGIDIVTSASAVERIAPDC